MRFVKACTKLVLGLALTFRAVAERLDAETDLVTLQRYERSTTFVKTTIDDARRVAGKASIWDGGVKSTENFHHAPRYFDNDPPPPPPVPATNHPNALSDESADEDEHDRAFAILGELPWPGLVAMAAAYVREQGAFTPATAVL